MELEKILSTIGEKLGKTSLSQATLRSYVTLNPVAEGTEPDDEYFNRAVSFLNTLQGQYNHDVATQVEEMKKNFAQTTQTQTNTSAPAVDTKNVHTTGIDEETVNALKEALTTIKELKAEREAEKLELTKSTLMKSTQESLKAVIENGGKNQCNDGILQLAVSQIDYGKGITQEEALTIAKSNYEKTYKSVFGNGATPFEGNGNGVQDTDNPNSFIEQLKLRDAQNAEKMKVIESELK